MLNDIPQSQVGAIVHEIIENWQEGLKRITLRIIWADGLNNAEPCLPGAKFEFCQTAYLHENSDYGHGE